MRELEAYPDVPLKDLVLESRPITYGIVQPGPDVAPDGIPLIRGKDYSSGKVDSSALYHVRPEIDRPYARSRVRGGDILLSIVGYVGQAAMVPHELSGANITQTTARIAVDPTKADSGYIYHHLSAPHFRPHISRFEKGSAQPGLNLSDLGRLRVLLPSRAAQGRIAEILSTVDETIEKTDALIEKRKAIKAGLVHDLFTRGVTKDGQLRPPREQAPQLYKESSLGWVPKEWQIRDVGSVCQKVTDGDHHTPQRAETGVYLLSARNVLDSELALRDVDFVPEHEYQRMIRRCYPEPGDILISCSGTIGRVCVVPAGFRCALVRSAALLKLDRAVVRSGFVEAVLQSSSVRRQVRASQRQAAQPNLFQAEISALIFALPSADEQARIEDVLRAAEHQIAAECRGAEKLRILKTGLMRDLITGNVRV